MTKHIALYVRCSTDEQTTANQLTEQRDVAAKAELARQLVAAGESGRRIAKLTGLSRPTVLRLRRAATSAKAVG